MYESGYSGQNEYKVPAASNFADPLSLILGTAVIGTLGIALLGGESGHTPSNDNEGGHGHGSSGDHGHDEGHHFSVPNLEKKLRIR